ncbi:MAG: alpha-E domain-containing protein, partial [Alphaproteobacteria bacterium]|nr:alpha-E domain-containing protein [Alphaproteobacteria bacterium]
AVRRAGTLAHGAVLGSMLREEGFHFARAGTFIERADNIARIMDIKYYLLLPSLSYVGSSMDTGQWDMVLRSVSGDSAYRWLNAGQIDARGIVNFLVLDERFPRSLAYSHAALRENLAALARIHGVEGRSNELMRESDTRLSGLSIEDVFDKGLHKFLTDFTAANSSIAHAIGQDYRFLA